MTATPPQLQAVVNESLPFSRPPTPGLHAHNVGFVGLGAMGYKMARNLANRQTYHQTGSTPPPVLVYNRTVAKSESLLKELGAAKIKIAQNPEQVAKECDVIITCLASDDAVKSMYESFCVGLEDAKHDRPKIFVEASTIYPALAGELDLMLSHIPRTHLITCPVFGRPSAAEHAQLILVMAGDYRSKKEVAYLLVPAVGRRVIDVGGNLEKAPTFKLIGNSLILGFMEAMAESMTMAEKTGIGSETTLDFIRDMFPAVPLVNYATKIANNQFDGTKGFAIDGGIKDASHIRRLTNEHNTPMPMIDIAHQHLLTARAIYEAQKIEGQETYEVLDWCALVAGSRVAGGLDGLGSGTKTKVVRDD
ncbi:NAD-P-binding protein [Rickenella mellea]|uniref:NAD-P-binding protein n=1 Tax=Rickenella mellea TaxID=50990 RepID=A0A4Y7QPQ8_9AGAM|nr:NAD-P-binding protein [Rickenella mellea]